MKLENSKHAHNLTKLLKVCLFGMLMLFPFLAMLPSTLYFAFNEHAQNYTHEEVITTYEYETNEVNSVDDLVVGNIYKITMDSTFLSTYNANAYDTTFTRIFIDDYLKYNIQEYDVYKTIVYIGQLNINVNLFIDNSNEASITSYPKTKVNSKVEFYFVYMSIYDNNLINLTSASDYLGEKNVEVVSSEQSPLKAFYSASNELWQQPMFSWVNTGLGSIAIANMLSVFGIAQNTFISNILIYWLSLTAIYIIIDIIIEAFTALTHLFTKKAN